MTESSDLQRFERYVRLCAGRMGQIASPSPLRAAGSLCWLLGLREVGQVGRDPPLGHLFENLVNMEAIKERFNRAELAPLYFHRDSTGNEVDLLIPTADRMHAAEIKAGATVNPDYFRGISNFAKAFPNAVASGQVIYGGEQEQRRSRWPVVSWRTLAAR